MLKHNDKYVFYFDPNNYCGDLECSTCGGRMWITDWEVFKEKGADLDDYLKEGDEIYLYWALTDEGVIWHRPEHIKPEMLMEGCIAKKDGEDWYAMHPDDDDGSVEE
jgi:hypothetical protein